jgi:RHS repeat-associated protein
MFFASGYTGKERDTESGLDYFGARYYTSTMGRWMSPDWADKPEAVPYSDLMNPQSLNLYGYVNNNPLRSVDSDGHDEDEADPQQVTMTPAEAKQAAAMAYSENTRGSISEGEAYVSTAVNRVDSGDKSYLNGSGGDLNLTNVINAPNQYQGVGGTNFITH